MHKDAMSIWKPVILGNRNFCILRLIFNVSLKIKQSSSKIRSRVVILRKKKDAEEIN